MAPIRQFFLRLLSLVRNGTAERELGREIEAHLSLLEDEFIAKGMPAADAKLSGSRVVATDTSMPLRANALARAWPTPPKPIIA